MAKPCVVDQCREIITTETNRGHRHTQAQKHSTSERVGIKRNEKPTIKIHKIREDEETPTTKLSRTQQQQTTTKSREASCKLKKCVRRKKEKLSLDEK
jgi:hypothetical protein